MNTIGTGTYGSSWRAKYFSSNLQQVLRKSLVAEKICNVDRGDAFYIHNPYSNQPTAAVQALTGTYSVSAWTVTDDSLTVTDEVIYGEHVFDFERMLNNYNLMANRFDEMAYAISYGIDNFVVNALCEDGTGTYSTPSGGFTTPSNIPVIFANIIAKTSGFADSYRGLYVVLENSDLTGLVQTQASSGFNYADTALRNGLIGNYLGVDIYVVRDGTFVDATIGTKTVTNLAHRVAGVKQMSTFAAPRGLQYDEKGVSGKTGKEIAVYGYVGFKQWTQKASLTIDITVTA